MYKEFEQIILKHSQKITFNKEFHSYCVGDKRLKPVTTTIKKFQEPFDSDSISTKYATKYKKNKEDVLKEWDKKRNDSAELGTNVHDYGEGLFYNYKRGESFTLPNEPHIPHKKQMFLFWKELDKNRYIPILAETKVFSLLFGFAGTFDLLLYDTVRKGLIIADYKTNEDLNKNFMGKRLLEPFSYTLDTPYNMYQLQTSCYQIPLEDLKLPVVDRWLIHITPTNYVILPCNNFVEHLKKALSC
jgi:hypothetical protein